jgi:PAS domain S-box-containing protein
MLNLILNHRSKTTDHIFVLNAEGANLSSDAPIYNSRIFKNYVEYVEKHYPAINIDSLLEKAGMTRYEVDDEAHWLSQSHADRLHEGLVAATGASNISREVGRGVLFSNGVSPMKKYILGLLDPSSGYLFMGKNYPLYSRGVEIKTRKIGANRIEITCKPKPGVEEKPYQCENRTGSFESLSKLFTGKYPKVDHPSCFHKGHDSCRYLIEWEKPSFLAWRRGTIFFLLFALILSLVTAFILPAEAWTFWVLVSILITVILSWKSENSKKNDLIATVKTQGDAAKGHINEMNIRYNNAVLVQEIGQATSMVLNVEKIVTTVLGVLEKRLDFARGVIFLANRGKNRLIYAKSYGYTKEKEELLQKEKFHLDNPKSKGVFVLCFRDRKPYFVRNVEEIEEDLSPRSLELVKKLEVSSLVCVPIVYENESLGILAVDNVRMNRALTQSDVSLLTGVASQIASCIINAVTFQKIGESEQNYRELVETANSIILRMDPDGTVNFINEFGQRFFGYKEEEIIGKNAKGTIIENTPQMRKDFRRLIKAFSINPQRCVVNEQKHHLKNGDTVWVTWTYKYIFRKDGPPAEILCIGNDITELKRADKEKRNLERRLQRAEKMEALGTMAGGVAHDLNNVLTGLVSYPELLLMKLPDDSPLRKHLLTMQRSGEKAAAIVQDLLTLARRGVSITEVVNLNDVITAYLESPEYEKLLYYHENVEVESNLEKDILDILGSPTHLSKTIMNLVSNAAEAMPDGGKVLISTENLYIDCPINGYEKVQEGDYVILRVSDNGVGIPPEEKEKIFEPFYTKKVMGRSGTGLGMAVVWGTVKDHNGYIDIQNNHPKGTTFKIYFPVTREKRDESNLLISRDEYQGHGESILVVDDIEEQREIATAVLTELGYSIDSVSSGEKAVEYLQNNKVDLVVLDMIMDPGIDGLETYRRILEVSPDQKAVIVSGFSESERVKDAQELGAGAYVKKPYLSRNIGPAIRAELDK